ncbi:MAG: hypothetical protein AB7I79_06715 [Rhizobiaceae bacterium]
MKPSAEQIRRHYDGSIDIGHYASRAAAERQAARRLALAGAFRALIARISDIWFRVARI